MKIIDLAGIVPHETLVTVECWYSGDFASIPLYVANMEISLLTAEDDSLIIDVKED